MEDAFGTIVWVVAILGTVVAIFTLVGSGRTYRQIGGGGLVHEDRDARAESPAVRDEEIREHVVARNARRVRAGEDPLDVDEEIERRIRDLT